MSIEARVLAIREILEELTVLPKDMSPWDQDQLARRIEEAR